MEETTYDGYEFRSHGSFLLDDTIEEEVEGVQFGGADEVGGLYYDVIALDN
jgi:hypothetical protein